MNIEQTFWTKDPKIAEELINIYKYLSITYKSEKIENQWKITVTTDYHRIVTLAEDIYDRLTL